MGKELIQPIDEHTAKAIAEVSKLGSKGLDVGTSVGSYVGSILGDLPKNLIGMLGDKIYFARLNRFNQLAADHQQRLSKRGISGAEASPALAIPIIDAAVDETRSELLDLWQRLLANAADPTRSHRVRDSFIAILKRFDPMDAQVFQVMGGTPHNLVKPNARDFVVETLRSPMEEVLVSFENLQEMGCLSASGRDAWDPIVTNRGQLLYQALEP
jgi:hypothetical protein